MRRRGGNGGGAPADLLVCFPSGAHLALMPKPICSPSRSTDPPKRHPSRPATRRQASPLFKTKARNAARGPAAAEVISEPTSPKVTCAGQIKVSRPKPRAPASATASNKSWLAVMEEMEELRRRQRRGRGHWLEALGLKKDAMHLLHALRGLRLHMSCFGSFRGPAASCTSDEEDDDVSAGREDAEEEDQQGKHNNAPRTIFSKWFMLLEESPGEGSLIRKEVEEEEEEQEEEEDEEEEEGEREGAFGGCLVTPASLASTSTSAPPPPPPPNALLLMRCRSAPAKRWLNGGDGDAGGGEGEMTAWKMREEEKEKERLVLMSYAPDFFKISPDIAQETWVVGSFDPLGRSRSWKR